MTSTRYTPGREGTASRLTDLIQPLPTVWNDPSQSNLRMFIALPSQSYSHFPQSDFRYVTNWPSISDCTQFICRDECVQKSPKQCQRCISSFGLHISAEQTNKCSTRIMLFEINGLPTSLLAFENLPTQE